MTIDGTILNMLLEGIRDTVYMTLASTLAGYALGLPMGILLTVTDKDGIRPNKVIYGILDVISNIVRSVPFLILLIVLIPFTRWLVGKSYGSTATIVPLVITAAPYIGRLVESSLKEVDKGVVEAAQSMGAGTWEIIWKVLLPEARTSLLVGAAVHGPARARAGGLHTDSLCQATAHKPSLPYLGNAHPESAREDGLRGGRLRPPCRRVGLGGHRGDFGGLQRLW